MDWEEEYTAEVEHELRTAGLDNECFAVVYTLCVDRVGGPISEIASHRMEGRWRRKQANGDWHPMLQLRDLALPVLAFQFEQWVAVIHELINRRLLVELTDYSASELASEYAQGGIECVPLRTPQAGDVKPTEKAIRGLRHLGDSGVVGYMLCPEYIEPSGHETIIVSESNQRGVHCIGLSEHECDLLRGGVCRVRTVRRYWDTPYSVRDNGIAICCGRPSGFSYPAFSELYQGSPQSSGEDNSGQW